MHFSIPNVLETDIRIARSLIEAASLSPQQQQQQQRLEKISATRADTAGSADSSSLVALGVSVSLSNPLPTPTQGTFSVFISFYRQVRSHHRQHLQQPLLWSSVSARMEAVFGSQYPREGCEWRVATSAQVAAPGPGSLALFSGNVERGMELGWHSLASDGFATGSGPSGVFSTTTLADSLRGSVGVGPGSLRGPGVNAVEATGSYPSYAETLLAWLMRSKQLEILSNGGWHGKSTNDSYAQARGRDPVAQQHTSPFLRDLVFLIRCWALLEVDLQSEHVSSHSQAAVAAPGSPLLHRVQGGVATAAVAAAAATSGSVTGSTANAGAGSGASPLVPPSGLGVALKGGGGSSIFIPIVGTAAASNAIGSITIASGGSSTSGVRSLQNIDDTFRIPRSSTGQRNSLGGPISVTAGASSPLFKPSHSQQLGRTQRQLSIACKPRRGVFGAILLPQGGVVAWGIPITRGHIIPEPPPPSPLSENALTTAAHEHAKTSAKRTKISHVLAFLKASHAYALRQQQQRQLPSATSAFGTEEESDANATFASIMMTTRFTASTHLPTILSPERVLCSSFHTSRSFVSFESSYPFGQDDGLLSALREQQQHRHEQHYSRRRRCQWYEITLYTGSAASALHANAKLCKVLGLADVADLFEALCQLSKGVAGHTEGAYVHEMLDPVLDDTVRVLHERGYAFWAGVAVCCLTLPSVLADEGTGGTEASTAPLANGFFFPSPSSGGGLVLGTRRVWVCAASVALVERVLGLAGAHTQACEARLCLRALEDLGSDQGRMRLPRWRVSGAWVAPSTATAAAVRHAPITVCAVCGLSLQRSAGTAAGNGTGATAEIAHNTSSSNIVVTIAEPEDESSTAYSLISSPTMRFAPGQLQVPPLQQQGGGVTVSRSGKKSTEGCLIVQCVQCGHGGHVEHIEEWWKSPNVYCCPKGCACVCTY